jgi:hypothetical protein
MKSRFQRQADSSVQFKGFGELVPIIYTVMLKDRLLPNVTINAGDGVLDSAPLVFPPSLTIPV